MTGSVKTTFIFEKQIILARGPLGKWLMGKLVKVMELVAVTMAALCFIEKLNGLTQE